MLSLNDYRSELGIDKWIAELGRTNAPIPRQGVRTALAFFSRAMPSLPLPDAVGFLAAMDLSKAVTETTLKPGERVVGFRTPTESPFKLFFVRRGASPERLGVNTVDRRPVSFVVRSNVSALESFTTGAIDTWTRAATGQPRTIAPRAKKWFGQGQSFGVMVAAGGRQLIIPESYSSLVVESAPGSA